MAYVPLTVGNTICYFKGSLVKVRSGFLVMLVETEIGLTHFLGMDGQSASRSKLDA